MMPPVIMVSYAFMLPVSTAPNALAHARSGLTTLQMAKLGVVPVLASVCVVTLAAATYWEWLLNLDGPTPDWALNATSSSRYY